MYRLFGAIYRVSVPKFWFVSEGESLLSLPYTLVCCHTVVEIGYILLSHLSTVFFRLLFPGHPLKVLRTSII